MAVVITGTPGVGKHTVAKEVAKKLGLDMVDINEIARRSDLIEAGGETGDVDVSALEESLKGHLGSASLAVGHLAPYVLSSEQVSVGVVLRRNPYDLLATYSQRGYSGKKSTENAASEILGIIFHDSVNRFGDSVFQVDVSGGNPVKETVDIIRGGGNGTDVDWLGLVADNCDLGRFFPVDHIRSARG